MSLELPPVAPNVAPHPRTLGWLGTTALAMGGSNQSLFLIGALIAGQGHIPGQGSAAIPLLMLGLVLSWMAAPGWTELILMWPNRVGGIAATCAEAFRPYSPVLANLAGTCYWWGWVPTCGLTALLSASAIHQWYLPHISVPSLAIALVLLFMGVNLCGVRAVSRLVIPVATLSALLAFLSGLIPIITGHVDWRQATTFHLTTPFDGWFGGVTSAMAGLYLIGFAAPAFEAAACHVGETVDPARNVPRAMFASGAMATVYFVLLPVVWLGVLGPQGLSGELAQTLGPTFAPLLGGAAKAAAIWFMMFNMFHGTIQPLAGASRTLAQCAEDGLLPHILARRSRTDCPWVATLLTAGMAIAFLLAGDPIWLVAAANFTYLIGICLPSVAVWLLRRNAPEMARPWRAPNVTITLGLIAALVWGVSMVLGFQQFGLPTVIAGLALAYAGSALYALRRWTDRRQAGIHGPRWSLHAKLTGAMLLVLILDGTGYLIAIHNVPSSQVQMVTALADIFVVVALLTISVGLVLPGMISHAAEEVARAADRLATGTLADFSRAMQALGQGDLEAAHARVDVAPVIVHSNDEVGAMAASFNTMQRQMAQAAQGLNDAREGLRRTRAELTDAGARYRSIFENAIEGIFQSSPEG
nr:amino acid permease [Armatimonadota bacterium]